MASMRLALLCAASAHAYTPPRSVRRSPRGPKPPKRPAGPATPAVEPLESWGAFDVGRHRIGVSTVSWGDTEQGWRKGFKRGKKDPDSLFGMKDARLAYRDLAQGGVQTWAVAAGSPAVPIFGRAVEKATDADPPKVVVHTAPSLRARFFGSTFGRNRYGFSSVPGAIRDALEILGNAYLDLVLAGPPEPRASTDYVVPSAGALARAGGRVEAVGVANVRGGAALRKAHAAYQRRGLRLAACMVEFSLVDNGVLRDGTLEAAKELDITVLARSPFAGGLGSGLCTVNDPTGGQPLLGAGSAGPKWRFQALSQMAPLHDAMEQVARMVEKRRNDEDKVRAEKQNREPKTFKVTPPQVALSWIAAKGAVPLPAVKVRKHAEVVLGCQGWRLEADEVAVLDAVLPAAPPTFQRKKFLQ